MDKLASSAIESISVSSSVDIAVPIVVCQASSLPSVLFLLAILIRSVAHGPNGVQKILENTTERACAR